MIEHRYKIKDHDWRPMIVPSMVTHCPCCGAVRSECVCWSSYAVDTATSEHISRRCEPSDHGREHFGFGHGA